MSDRDKYIWEYDTDAFRGACILLDIDGTITVTDHETVPADAFNAVQQLKQHNIVVLFSNGRDVARNYKIARLLDIPYVQSSWRKPFPQVVRDLAAHNHHKFPVVVVGDLFLTDGLLALSSGAHYVRVKRVLEKNTMTLKRRAFFLLDDILSRTLQPILFLSFGRRSSFTNTFSLNRAGSRYR